MILFRNYLKILPNYHSFATTLWSSATALLNSGANTLGRFLHIEILWIYCCSSAYSVDSVIKAQHKERRERVETACFDEIVAHALADILTLAQNIIATKS